MKNKPVNAGLGCVTFGREITQQAAFEILDTAFECGLNFFDTAAAYGEGASEKIIGQWARSRQHPAENFTIATKILPPFHPADIIASVNKSLERLGTDWVDILYLHRWHSTFDNPASLRTLDKLISNGLIRGWGASNFNAQQLNKTLTLLQQQGSAPPQFIQNNHNLAVSDIDDDIRHICEKNEIEIITYSPLGAGFLSGKHQHGVIPGSRFDLLPAHQNIYFNDNAQKRLSKLQEVAARTGYTTSHLALAWAFHQPGISRVLVGARTTGHIIQAVEAMAFDDAALFYELTCV